MKKILISACLVGDKCRYDGKTSTTPYLESLLEKYELVPMCCEMEGGLKCPRIPHEIKGDRVINKNGKDNTEVFIKGAEKIYNVCLFLNIDTAILKDHSPSCGVNEIYDGTFTNKLIPGEGILTAYLKEKGIRVISENEIPMFLEENPNYKEDNKASK